jgi:hypothetical protein
MGLFVPLAALCAFGAHVRGRDLYAGALALRLGRWLMAFGSVMLVAWIYKISQM